MVWIGSKKFSNDMYHHPRWKLEWGVHNFTLLGINFSVNIDKMESLNYDAKIEEIGNPIGYRRVLRNCRHILLALPRM